MQVDFLLAPVPQCARGITAGHVNKIRSIPKDRPNAELKVEFSRTFREIVGRLIPNPGGRAERLPYGNADAHRAFANRWIHQRTEKPCRPTLRSNRSFCFSLILALRPARRVLRFFLIFLGSALPERSAFELTILQAPFFRSSQNAWGFIPVWKKRELSALHSQRSESQIATK